MINYAHRGASDFAPENTLSAFYLGLQQGANGIETDVRLSRDGVPVLFHDDTLDRVTDGAGPVSEMTWAQLQKLLVTGPKARGFVPDRMVTLAQFLHLFAHRPIHFALELKGPGVQADTLTLARRAGILERCIFTSFDWDALCRTRSLDGDAAIGFLTDRTDDGLIEQMRTIRGQQLCLKADTLTPQVVAHFQRAGFSVRAWGVSNPELMEHVLACGVDGGMTVNFPGLLHTRLG
ncbi:MAG: glycerophosphodiester phosphodiesterase [Christensenellales bacterium]|jgi:glycerophosphoryl diester phosphodiesterase